MTFEIKASIVQVDSENRSIVKATTRLAAVESFDQAKLLVEYARDQIASAEPPSRPLPVE